MKKEDFLALGLEEQAAEKAAKASVEELSRYVPKVEHEALTQTRAQLEKEVAARDKQIEGLKKIDPEQLQQQIAALQEENTANKAQFDKELKSQKLDAALTLALTAAKAKNVRAVKALLELDPEKAELDEKGVILGLAEQIKTLQSAEDSKFLFETGKQTPVIRGFEPGNGRGPADGSASPDNMTYTELCAYLEQNPDTQL